jgi:Arc/MetJ-type ribon-helix-helix transcriptional regulator
MASGNLMSTKVRTTVTIDKELMDWILEKITEKRFASVSHAMEYSVKRVIDREREDIHFEVIGKEKSLISHKRRNT